MGFRIFMALLVLLNGWFGYQIVQQYRAHSTLTDVPAGYSIQQEQADLTVVVFFDYTCPLCRSVDPIFREAMRRDGKVRYVPRPVTIDATSEKYSNTVYAAGEQGKFMEMHDAIITDFRAMDDTRRKQLAETLKLDLAKLNADITSDNVVNKIEENLWLTRYYYTVSLPQFVIGDYIFTPNKNTTVEDFLKLFEEARRPQ